MIKVMLVDDEYTVRHAMEKLLAWEEWNVKVIGSCSNALEALEEMTNEMPDILITDVKMPVVSGIELISRAREMYPFLQCVVLSGYDEFALAQAAMSEGVRHYLLKPCTKEKVEKVIKECMMQMEKDKKSILQENGCRETVIEKIIADLLEMSSEEKEINAQRVREVMTSYRETQLWRDAAISLILRCWSQIDSQKAVQMISGIYQEKEQSFEYVTQTLLKFRMLAQSEESFIDRIQKYADDNYQNPNLTLKYVAEHVVFMNAQYAGKQFQKKVGIKFSEYLLKVRMEQAVRLLTCHEKYKMFEIAEKVGLGNNVQYFYQLFKRYTGMTPKEYQEHSNL